MLKVRTKPKVLGLEKTKLQLTQSSGGRRGRWKGRVVVEPSMELKHANRLESIQRRETRMIKGLGSLPYEERTGFVWP